MGTRTITEGKATCKACGNVWYYGKFYSQTSERTCDQPLPQASMGFGPSPHKKTSSCCDGGIKNSEPSVKGGDRCSKCGSADVENKIMKYEVSGRYDSEIPAATWAKKSIWSQPISTINISGRSVLIGIGAIILILNSRFNHNLMLLLNVVMTMTILAYLVYIPAREKLSATLKFIPPKGSTGKVVGLLLFFGFCTLLSVAAWSAAREESRKARAPIEAEIARNLKVFNQVDAALAANEFEIAMQLITKATDNPETMKEKEKIHKLVAEKSMDYFANQGINFSHKGKWREAYGAFTKFFGLALPDTGMADDMKQAIYRSAIGLSESNGLEEAVGLFNHIKDMSDSTRQIVKLKEAIKEKQYSQAVLLFEQKKYTAAQRIFVKLGTHSDSAGYLTKANKIVEEQKRIAAFKEKIAVGEKSVGEMNQAIKRSDIKVAGSAFSIGKVSLEEAEKLIGKNSKIAALRVKLNRGKVKINKIAATQERQRKIAKENEEAEQQYIAQIRPILEVWTMGLIGISNQSDLAGTSPMLLYDSEWILRTALFLASLKDPKSSIKKISPPPRFRPAHRVLRKAARLSSQCADLYAQGIDEINANKMLAAMRKMDEMTVLLNRGTALLPK